MHDSDSNILAGPAIKAASAVVSWTNSGGLGQGDGKSLVASLTACYPERVRGGTAWVESVDSEAVLANTQTQMETIISVI